MKDYDKIISDFEKFLKESDPAEINKIIDEVKAMNLKGPTVEEYFEIVNEYHKSRNIMSKTVTLETAKSLKAAFDKAGIEMPETEFHFMKYGNWGYRWAANKKPKYYPGQTIPAPDAEELGQWLKGLKWWGSKPREILTPHIEIEERGYYVCLLSANDTTESWTVSHSHPTIAEGLAALFLRLFEKDAEQIKKHLAQ